jgi:hypothetical protein
MSNCLWLIGLVAAVGALERLAFLLCRAAEREDEQRMRDQRNVGTRLSPRNGADTRAAPASAARTGVERVVSISDKPNMPVVSDSLDLAHRAGASPSESPVPARSAGATSSPQDGAAPAEARAGGRP